MAYDEPLRITCEGCPRGADCDCLVEFILAERDAEVVRFDADARRRIDDRRGVADDGDIGLTRLSPVASSSR